MVISSAQTSTDLIGVALNGLGSYLHYVPLISYLGTSLLMLSHEMPHDLSQCPDMYKLEMCSTLGLNFWPMGDRCWWTNFFTSFPLLDGLSWGHFIWILEKQSQGIEQSLEDEEKTHLIGLLSSLPHSPVLYSCSLGLNTVMNKLVSQTPFFFWWNPG